MVVYLAKITMTLLFPSDGTDQTLVANGLYIIGGVFVLPLTISAFYTLSVVF